jgi:hypothetical protein
MGNQQPVFISSGYRDESLILLRFSIAGRCHRRKACSGLRNTIVYDDSVRHMRIGSLSDRRISHIRSSLSTLLNAVGVLT